MAGSVSLKAVDQFHSESVTYVVMLEKNEVGGENVVYRLKIWMFGKGNNIAESLRSFLKPSLCASSVMARPRPGDLPVSRP